MNKQIGNKEYRIILILAYIDLNGGKVFFNNNSVKRKRQGNPLIFLDASVIMRIKISYLGIFIKRVALKVKSGRINMSS